MRNRSPAKPHFIAAVLAAALAAACDHSDREPHPLDVLRFPTDLAVGGADGDTLYVVGANFDRLHAGGAIQMVDLGALGSAIEGVEAGDAPVTIRDVPWLGGAHIGNFGGRIAVASMDDGGERLFVPLRGDGSVAVLDVSPEGEIACHPEGGTDCRESAIALPTETGLRIADPFAAAVVGRYVFVGALRTQARDEAAHPGAAPTAFMARLDVRAPEEVAVRPLGRLITRDLVASPDGVRLFAAGARPPATGGGSTLGEVRSLSSVAFDEEVMSSETRSLSQVVGSSDGRAIVFSADGRRAYALTRSPSALVEFDAAAGAASLEVRSTVALPDAPSRMMLVEQDGARLAFVTATMDDALAVVDLERREVAAVLDGTVCDDLEAPCPGGSRYSGSRDPSTDVGIQPWGLVALQREGGGVRVWVGSFGDGTLRAVDVPDLRRPSMARVTAVVGGLEDEQ